MAQENSFATGHGIDYYAFCTYPIGCADYSPPDSACVGAQCCADNYKLSYLLCATSISHVWKRIVQQLTY